MHVFKVDGSIEINQKINNARPRAEETFELQRPASR